MTDEQRKARITALLEERRGYEQRGQKDRVGQVDAELKLIGHEAKTPARRASKRSR